MGSGADSPYQGADTPCQGEMSRRDKRGREMARRARGGRESDYEHEVLIRSRPRRRFGDFAAAGKVTRRPQAAKSPVFNVPYFIIFIIATSSGPSGHLSLSPLSLRDISP